jgi:hypothetical protein
MRWTLPSSCVLAALLFGSALPSGPTGPAAIDGRTPLSFHNRLLLNRLVLNGETSGEVMLLARPGRLKAALDGVARAGGRVIRAESDVEYVRAAVPVDRFAELTGSEAIEAYQIASLAAPSWYPSANPQSRAETERINEADPVARAAGERPAALHELSPDEARGGGYTADEDAGVGLWHAEHPTFDGRGVTIAFLETGLVEFGHPALQAAKALDGSDVPKIAGIVNTLGPDAPDVTRVDLTTAIRTTGTWYRDGNRTYILPRPGQYRFGLFTLPVGKGLVQEFAVIRDEHGDVWIDTNSDDDFRDERPLVDANTRLDLRHLDILYPRQLKLAFAFTQGHTPEQVHIYPARSGHATMTVSVAAGNRAGGALASGVAPGARALVVRYNRSPSRLHNFIEGYLEIARRSDVDIMCDSTALGPAPDAAGEFARAFFDRLTTTYRKPIFRAAGNGSHIPNGVSAIGGVFSVGGVLGPASFASLYGGAHLSEIVVHPFSAAGPGLDGALEPEFVAPENRIAASTWINDAYPRLPRNAATRYLPAGYEISCCTSASSPYAAGVAALLLSAAKQTGTPHSVERLGRAMQVGARFLSEWPAYKQGNGVLDVNAAWQELQRATAVPRITGSGSNVHQLTPYIPDGNKGPGLFEQYGWKVGQRGERLLHLTRATGREEPTRYRVSWTGNDGTFTAPPAVVLPRGAQVALPIGIHARTPGAHSALLSLHDPATDAIVYRTQATIIAPEMADSRTAEVRFTGTIPLMQAKDHFFRVPPGANVVSVDLEVNEGSLIVMLTPPDGLNSGYFDHVRTTNNRTFPKGRYHVLWPLPPGGTWSVNLRNTSAYQEVDPALVSTTSASYSVVVRLLGAAINVGPTTPEGAVASITNTLGLIRQPDLQVSPATRGLLDGYTAQSGLPTLIDIDVPADASSLRVNARALSTDENLELYLHDCSSGECFIWDFRVPPARQHSMVVRKPAPGRWVAAINAAPWPARQVRFIFEDIIAAAPVSHRQAPATSKARGDTWTEQLTTAPTPIRHPGRESILLWELFDAAAARDALAHPWENRAGVVSFADRPIDIAASVSPIK